MERLIIRRTRGVHLCTATATIKLGRVEHSGLDFWIAIDPLGQKIGAMRRMKDAADLLLRKHKEGLTS